VPYDEGQRIVVNSGEYGEHRLFIVEFDPKAGNLEPDTRFRDPGSDRPGVSMEAKSGRTDSAATRTLTARSGPPR
jgi:hypothetical protein